MNNQFDRSRVYYSAIGIVLLLFYVFNPVRIIQYTLYALLPLTIVTGVYRDMKMYGKKNPNYKYLKLLLAGFIFVALAEISSYFLKYIYNIKIFPAPSDYLWMIAIVFLFWGMITKIRQSQITISKLKIIILSVISIIGIGAIIYFINNPELSTYQNVVNIFFRISQFGFVIVIYLISEIMNEYKNGKIYKPWLYLLIGSVFNLLAGVILAVFLTKFKQGEYIYVFWVNVIWGLGYLFIGYAFCHLGNILENSTKNIRLKMRVKKLLSHSGKK